MSSLPLRIDHPVPLFESTVTVLLLEGDVVVDEADFHRQLAAVGLAHEEGQDEHLMPFRGLTWDEHFETAPRPDSSRGRWIVAVTETTTLSTIAHEALHVVVKIAAWHGLPLDTDNDEVLAYLQGWLTYEIFKDLTAPR